MDVTVDTLSQLLNSCTEMKSLMRLALFTRPEDTITVSNVLQLPSARTATHTNHASFQTPTTSTKFQNTVQSVVKTP